MGVAACLFLRDRDFHLSDITSPQCQAATLHLSLPPCGSGPPGHGLLGEGLTALGCLCYRRTVMTAEKLLLLLNLHPSG